MKKIRIGLPRALLYHKYHIFWEEFLTQLGFEVITSPETNKEILKRGTSLAIDESCLSLKLYLGHVEWLMPRVDYIFIPRIVSLRKREALCTKFMGLGDISRNTFHGLKAIEYTVDIIERKFELFSLIEKFSKFEKNIFKIIRAYRIAKRKEKETKKKELMDQLIRIRDKDPKKPTVLIVSHPYTTYDALLGKPISKFLDEQGIEVIYADIAPMEKCIKLSDKISRDLYWTYNKELLGAIEFYRKKIDGIVFLMVFPCGPDALVVNLCQNKINDLPISVITLDELEGDAGLKTRLESFSDILKIKKQKNEK
jgi:predicted nucleotide-binding protein (sugar kinase/HSP70/actin superfamily)